MLPCRPRYSETVAKRPLFTRGLKLCKTLSKQKISIALDADVLSRYRYQAGGRGSGPDINSILRSAMQQQDLAEILRRVLREELSRPKSAGA